MIKRITFKPSCFVPACVMEINVPNYRDAEEYIDEYLDGMLNEEIKWNCDWSFLSQHCVVEKARAMWKLTLAFCRIQRWAVEIE